MIEQIQYLDYVGYAFFGLGIFIFFLVTIITCGCPNRIYEKDEFSEKENSKFFKINSPGEEKNSDQNNAK